MDQLVEIIKVRIFNNDILQITFIGYKILTVRSCWKQVLGTPTREEIRCMNPHYTDFRFPQIKAHPWHKVCVFSPLTNILVSVSTSHIN